MKNLKVLLLITIWTSAVLLGLYLLDAHQNYREIGWALFISVALLITHMVNFSIYFKLRGNEPYKWFN